MNLSLFGEYKTVNTKGENIEIKDLEKLSTLIFTKNSSWRENMLSQIARQQNNNTFSEFLKEGYFRVYIYDYEVPPNPQSEKDRAILMLLKEWGKFRSEELEKIYWIGDRTLNKLGFGLMKMDSMFKDFKLVNGDDEDFIVENLEKYTPIDYITYRYSKKNNIFRNDLQVYCGSIDLTRLMSEVKNGIKYFIIFPFRDDIMNLKQGDKAQFFLLEKTDYLEI